MSTTGESAADVADESTRSNRRALGGVGRAENASTDVALSDLDQDELTTLIEELRSENRRLRAEYVRAKRSEYRRSAVVLLVLGVVAVLGGVVFPIAREVLLILGAVGLFSGGLTWYLSPERLITATVGRSVYESVAEIGSGLSDELGLQQTNVYVPVDHVDVTGAPVRLFVPQSPSYEVPDNDELDSLFTVSESTEKRGISVRPTAARLVREFEESTTGSVASEPGPLAAQLVDALVEQFELVDRADVDVDAESNRVTVDVAGGVYDETTGFDHPVASFLGVGLAFGLDRPVTVETTPRERRMSITCQW